MNCPTGTHHDDRPVPPDPANDAASPVPTGPSASRQVRDTVLAAVPPFALFSLLGALGVPYLLATLAGAAVPAVRLLVDRARGRRLDATSVVVAAFLLAGLVTAVASGDAVAVIASNSALWLLGGTAFAGSLIVARPLMRPISRYFLTQADPAIGPPFDRRYRTDAHLRRAFRRVTLCWALALVPVGAAGIVLAIVLPVAVAPLTQLFGPVACLVLGLWTTRTLRRAI